MAKLSGSINASAASVNLSTRGAVDWIHWNDVSGTGGNPMRKAGAGARISDYTAIGGASPTTAAGSSRTISWTGGTPTASGSDNVGIHSGVGVGGTGQGFSFTVPADASAQRLICNFSLYSGQGRLHASLSDGSATAIDIDSADTGAATESSENITLDFAAGSGGQTLTITWTLILNDGTGLIAVEAVSLFAGGNAGFFGMGM